MRKRPDFSALNVLKSSAEIHEWIAEDPRDPVAISEELNDLLVEYITCHRFISVPIKGRTKEQKYQYRDLLDYCEGMREDILQLCKNRTTRAVVDLGDEFCCYIQIYLKEDPDGDERFSKWEIKTELARKLKSQKS